MTTVPAPQRSLGTTNARLQQIGSAATYRRGDVVIRMGDPAEYIFSVVSGALRAVRLLADGRRCITNFLMPGDFFGLTQRDRYAQIVEIVADATLNRYPRRSFEALIDADPRVGRLFFNVMCDELSAIHDRILLISRKTALERISEFLLAMADRRCDGACGKRDEIELPMTRNDIADYLGLTVETVSRLLKQLRRLRIIDLPSVRCVVILKRDALEEFSNGHPRALRAENAAADGARMPEIPAS